MSFTTDRRALIGSAILAGCASLVTVSAASAAPVDRSAWHEAAAALERAEAEDAAFTPGYMATWERCRAECEAIPHVTFPPEECSGGRCQTTADEWEVRQARRDVKALDDGRMHLEPIGGLREHYALKRELVKAADDRDRQRQAIRGRYDMDRLDDRAERLSEQKVEAWSRLMDTPAPDLAALRWKLLQLREDGEDMGPYTSACVEQTYRDIDRLMLAKA